MICEVTIWVSDPWDLGEALGWRVLAGELVRLEDDDRGGRALIRLDAPIERAGVSCSHVVASPRHAGDALANLSSGQSVLCGFLGVADASAEATLSLDTSGWRGGVAFIGTIEPVPSWRRLLDSSIPIRSPADLSSVLSDLRAAVDSRALHAVSAGSPYDSDVQFSDVPVNGPWPDYIDLHFQDRAGRRYRLSAETYHGSAGSWSREEP